MKTNDTEKRELAEWEIQFLDTLAEECDVTRAVQAGGVDRARAYRERESDPEFARLWQDALGRGIETLEAKARSRALKSFDVLFR